MGLTAQSKKFGISECIGPPLRVLGRAKTPSDLLSLRVDANHSLLLVPLPLRTMTVVYYTQHRFTEHLLSVRCKLGAEL